MRKIILIATILGTIPGFAQLKFNAVGLGFDYNGGWNMSHSGFTNIVNEGLPGTLDQSATIGLNRVMVAYRFNLKPAQKDFFRLEADFLQGTEYMYYYDYESDYSSVTSSNDTSFSSSTSLDNNGAILGLRLKARFSTPSDRRFHYNFGIGIEGLYVFNNNTDGYNSYSYWTFNDYYSEQERLESDVLDPYHSINLIQQAGLAWRLGKDEASFPLNRTYLEGTFHVMTNFTTINKVMEAHRTYGFALALVYELGE